MKERELGSMQIAGEKIRILETSIPGSSFMAFDPDRRPPLIGPEGTNIESEWIAVTDARDKEWARAALVLVNSYPSETVLLLAHVDPSNLRLGLGRFMIRLGTDQAIRYRKRTILAEVENTNEGALKILDEEDFEKQPEAHPGFTLMKKELKWV